MTKFKKDVYVQYYKGYEIRVERENCDGNYCAYIFSQIGNVEFAFNKKIASQASSCQKAFKDAHKFIDEYEERLVFEENFVKLFVKLCFDGSWQCKVLEDEEVFISRFASKQEAIDNGINFVRNSWKEVAKYFGDAIFVKFLKEKGKYQCRVNKCVLGDLFDEDFVAIGSAMKIIDMK